MADSLDSGSSAHYGRAGSSPASRTKKERHPHGCLSFLVQHFCYAKVVACGRVTEREWGNPSKVPPSHSPFLAVGGSADNKTCGQPQKKRDIRKDVSFLLVRDFAARKPRPPAAALDMAPTPGQKRRRQRPSPFLLVNSQVKNPPISGTPLSGGPPIVSSWSPSGILKSSSASSPKKPFQPPSIIKASSTTISSWPSISSRW